MLLEEEKNKSPPKKCKCEENELIFSNIRSKNTNTELKNNSSKNQSIMHMQAEGHSSRYNTPLIDHSSLTDQTIQAKNFSKIINASKIILNDKLEKLKGLNEALILKLESLNLKQNTYTNSVRIGLKKIIHTSNELLEVIKIEILYLYNQSYNNYKIGIILENIIKEFFPKFEVFINLNINFYFI